MKIKILLSLLAVLFTVSFYSQKGKATIFFKEGKSLKGIVKIKHTGVIKYQKKKRAEKVIYDFNNIDHIDMYQGGDVATYVYLKVKGKTSSRVLEEMATGRANLYRIVTEGTTGGMPMGTGAGGMGMGMGMTMGHSYTLKSYYICKEGEKEVNYLGSTNWLSKSFKKAASEYFNDCPVLAKKIIEREYKKRDIREIVDFYNTECD